MIFFFLNKLRKLFKSLGKIENKIIDKLVLIEKNPQISLNKSILKDNNFINWGHLLKQKENYPKKLVIIICFFYNKKKFNILKRIIDESLSYKFKTDLTIITNHLSNIEKKNLEKLLKPNAKKINIQQINNLPDGDMLPWFSINIMKEKFKDKSNSHFMFLEDDILVDDENICYWVYFRRILIKLNLVPGFLRCEKYKNELYAVDNPKKLIQSKNPKILTKSGHFGFINSRYPYCGMYLMDRKLMKNYLNSEAIKVDFGFTNNFLKATAPIKELLNTAYAYLNIPKGFFNKLMIPIYTKGKIPHYCIVHHLDVKYANSKKLNNMGYGKIKLKNLLSK